MAPDVIVLTFGQLIAFAAVFIIRNRRFAPKRLTAAELIAQAGIVRAFIARSLRGTQATREDVKDLTQDVLLAAWEASEEERYRPDPDAPPVRALRAWLRALAFHRVSHHLEAARTRREELVADPPDVEREPTAERDLEREELRLALLDALRELPEHEGAVVIAHDIDEIPMEEIAAQQDTPVSTLYRWRTLGIAALIKALRPARR
ncbi:sigma-70 family RNA polymerase sigma factor [Sorangium sp. So ce1036]|uniref:RNA polymerase sigma factor n=1 Tax=Sorangium sp. So ce1036 TaxID=3133328 RepID=UPI003F0D073E